MTMARTDKEAFDFYRDPENQEPSGPAQRRSRKGMTSHVPVRFLPETIAKVKILASRDRKTVSAWIRDVVEREIERRLPAPRTEAMESRVTFLTPVPLGPRTEPQQLSNDDRDNNLISA
jgi:hypothetical protein